MLLVPSLAIAWEHGLVTNWLLELVRRKTANPPCHLFVSGQNPPHEVIKLPALHALSDEDFIQQLMMERKANLAPELLAHRELLSVVAPILRADYNLVETYTWKTKSVCNIPFTVFGGTDDAWTTTPALVQWQSYTTGIFNIYIFPGDHFFHQSNRRGIISSILTDLASGDDGEANASWVLQRALGSKVPDAVPGCTEETI